MLPDAYLNYGEDDRKAKMNARSKSEKNFHPADWAKVHEELTKWGSKCSDSNHTTMALLYSEYIVEVERAGKEATSKTVFYDTYNMWVKEKQLISHIRRQPGRRMELDFAGDTVFYINTETEKPVYTDDTELTTNVTGSILDEIDGQLFYFSSGVRGWATELKVYADGTFEGHY